MTQKVVTLSSDFDLKEKSCSSLVWLYSVIW